MDVILRDILVFLQSGNIWRHVLDLIDISLVAFFLYRLFLLVRGTQAVQLMFGVLLLALIGLLANLLDLRLLSWIFRNAAPAVLIGIIVLFQPEIEQVCQQADQGEQEHPEHQLDRLSPPDEQKQPVKEERDQADVDQIEDMAPDVPALEEHQDVAQDDVH